MFNNNQVNARKCAVVLTKVLYLLNHVSLCGEEQEKPSVIKHLSNLVGGL